MKTLFEYMDEMHQIDNRNPVGTNAEMMILDELRKLAENVALSNNIDKKDAMYMIKKVLEKVVR
jgi:hypothetical protein